MSVNFICELWECKFKTKILFLENCELKIKLFKYNKFYFAKCHIYNFLYNIYNIPKLLCGNCNIDLNYDFLGLLGNS